MVSMSFERAGYFLRNAGERHRLSSFSRTMTLLAADSTVLVTTWPALLTDWPGGATNTIKYLTVTPPPP
jgi:hypothetical protein